MRGKLTYANVMVTILAFVVLGGGGAYAASKLARNSVGTAQLKAGAVTGAKVKDGSLTGADVDASSLANVPSASRAERAVNATAAVGAVHAEDSDTVGGVAPSAFGSVMSGRLDGFPGGIGDRLAWASPTGQTAFGATGPAEVETLSPAQAMVVRDLFVHLTEPPGNNNEWLFHVVVDGQVVLACSTRGVAQNCTDPTGSGAVPAGSRLSVFAALQGLVPNPQETFEWGFRLVPAGAR